MKEIKQQAELIRKTKLIRNQYQSLKLSGMHYCYLKNFFQKHRWFVLGLIILLFAQGLIEALLIIFSRDQLSAQQKVFLAPFFWQLLAIFIACFFVNSFFSIKQEKTLGVWLANSIRRRLFKDYVDKPLEKMNQENKAELIAKIAYQLPLVSMGLTNTIFGALRWLMYLLVATLIAYLSHLNWWAILFSMLTLSVVIAVSAYFVARRYISQEVTYYSQLIKEIDINTSEKYFLKNFNQEKAITRRFDCLVDFDSFFRVRRDLWMRLGAKVVFALLLVVSIITHFFSQGFFAWINLIGPEEKFLFLFLMIYFSRALNESLKIGLYLFPARLGLHLTITKSGGTHRRGATLNFSQDLNFYSQKTKLTKNGPYYRHLNFVFTPGESYLFTNHLPSYKTALARLLAGSEALNPKAIKVKVDGRRLDYAEWQKFGAGICLFDPNFRSQKTIMEFILGNSKEASDFDAVEKAINIMAGEKLIANLISPKGNYNLSTNLILGNPLSGFALFAAHALVQKPQLIIIDNFWLDLEYPEVGEIIQTLRQKLPQSTMIIFSRQDNNYLKYQQKYVGDQNFSKEK